jgi:hypothetical protein
MKVRNLALADRHQETVDRSQGLSVQDLTDRQLLDAIEKASRWNNVEWLELLLADTDRRLGDEVESGSTGL